MKRIQSLMVAILLATMSGNVYAQKNIAYDYNLKKAYVVLNEEKDETKFLDHVNKQLQPRSAFHEA